MVNYARGECQPIPVGVAVSRALHTCRSMCLNWWTTPASHGNVASLSGKETRVWEVVTEDHDGSELWRVISSVCGHTQCVTSPMWKQNPRGRIFPIKVRTTWKIFHEGPLDPYCSSALVLKTRALIPTLLILHQPCIFLQSFSEPSVEIIEIWHE